MLNLVLPTPGQLATPFALPQLAAARMASQEESQEDDAPDPFPG